MRKINKPQWTYFLQIFLIATLLPTACRKEIVQPVIPDTSDNSFKPVFDVFWKEMSRNYVMWDIDATKWNDRYRVFSPIFAKLQTNKVADRLQASHHFRQLVMGLRDSHFSLQFNETLLADSSISPADIRLEQRPDYHQPYETGYFDEIAMRYLDQPYYDADYNTDPKHRLSYTAGTINNHILYFRVNTFSIYRAFKNGSNRIKSLLNFVFNSLEDPQITGFILDLRDNTGGDLYDLNFFAGRFTNTPLQYGSSRYKSGNNPFDYTPWMPAIITPMPASQKFSKKIIILTNIYSISMAELTTMALRALPNTTIIGERTYGATSLLTSTADLNSGSFTIGDFATVTTASALFRHKDGRIYEGIGFPPDISIPYDEETAKTYIDKPLEKAISFLKN